MRLIRMHVDDFGGLHNYDHDFTEGLNVVLQDNGWGKTTMAAFLKAMLYGLGTKRSNDITENERKRYLPWQGGKYGGSLDFEADGVAYRIRRTFGKTSGKDDVKILNLDTDKAARLDPDKIGETLFKLDASAFQRSVFINQNGLGIKDASSSIHARLNSIVSQANDVAAYDGAVQDLTEQIKFYEKRGDRGRLGDIKREISSLERQRGQLEDDIRRQDSDRARIAKLDDLITDVDQALEKKKEKLEEVSGEAKRQETNKEILDNINGELVGLQQKMDAIKRDLGGQIPEAGEIEQIKRQDQSAASLASQIEELEGNRAKLAEEYKLILKEYNGSIPDASQLDEIQSIYGELQGILSTGNEEAAIEEDPEGYAAVKAAADADADYVSRLRAALDGQADVQQLIRQSEELGRDIQKEKEAWDDKKKRFLGLSKDVEELQPEVEEKARYRHEAVGPVIHKLEELQGQQQLVDVKNEELAKESLSPEQEAQLAAYPEELPDAAEGNEALRKFRNAVRQQADIQGLNAKLDGEKSKEDSLKASFAQMDSIPDSDVPEMEEPKKSSGAAMVGAGAAVAVIGAILGFAVNPILAAVAAVGVILAILGAANNKNYKKKVQEYEAYQASSAQRQEAQKKKADIRTQLEEVQSAVADYERQIADRNEELLADQSDANAWFAKWGKEGAEISEDAINEILDEAEQIKKLREKKQGLSGKQQFVTEKMEMIAAERADIEDAYPEIREKTFAEGLGMLRSAETDYKIKADKLQTAVGKLDRFLTEAGASREELQEEESPGIAELMKIQADAEKELAEAVENANEAFAPIEIAVTTENAALAYREAEQILNEYEQHSDKIKSRDERQRKKREQIDSLQEKLDKKAAVLRDCHADLAMPKRLSKIREEVGRAASLKAKMSEMDVEKRRQKAKLDEASKAVEIFRSRYGKFEPESEDILEEIYAKAASYAKHDDVRKPLEDQKGAIGQERAAEHERMGAKEQELKDGIAELEKRRDKLRDEYMQKSDFIRQADQSLEKYPDVEQRIRELYDQKQKAQNTVKMLKRAIQLITQAKENLANRYLSKVEDTFNDYMQVWMDDDAIRGSLDIDFNIEIEKDDKKNPAEGYSTGTCDLIDFCMRLALVDTLFEQEQPFLILDDPFVNLDEEHLNKALELLNVMAADKQMIYFVCHPIRAVEANVDAALREKFVKLAEDNRKTIEERKSVRTEQKKIARKSPKEMYRMVSAAAAAPFRPAKPDYTITNNIFSMDLVLDGQGMPRDNSYELFFIDAVGHVLNDRQLVEVKDGKLSNERVLFCLNTRDDSGDQYELMIRESGQDDYEVVARIPFKAKLAFAGTFRFNF